MSFPASRSKMKKLRKDRGHDLKDTKINLVSILDILTVLLAFLLQSFSVEGDIITPSQALTLPASSAKKKPELALRIAVTQDYLLYEGNAIVEISKMMAAKDIVVPELSTMLEERKKTTQKIAANSSTVEFKGDVVIEADRKIRFDVLERVIYTCGQAGYSNFSLLVLKI